MADQPDEPNDIEAMKRQIAELQARLAAVQGGDDAAGKPGSKTADNDTGPNVTNSNDRNPRWRHH